MKTASFFQYFLLLSSLVIASGGAILGMDPNLFDGEIFKLTGKNRKDVGWRFCQGHPITPRWQVEFDYAQANMVLDKEAEGAQPIKNPITHQPEKITLQQVKLLVASMGNDINNPVFAHVNDRNPYYMYPIEVAIRDESLLVFEALLNAGVLVDGYSDYSPLKNILVELARRGDIRVEKLLQMLNMLVAKGASLDTQLPDHVGFAPDQTACRGCTAREFFNRISGSLPVNQVPQGVINAFKKAPANPSPTLPAVVSAPAVPKVTPAAQPQPIPQAPQNPTASVVTPAVPQAPTVPVVGAPQPATHPAVAPTVPAAAHPLGGTVSSWGSLSKSGIAKTTACFVALAAVAAATKLLYKSLFVQATQAPSQITIINASGAAITVGYMEIGSNKLNSMILYPDDEQLLDMNKIKLNIIVTEEQDIKKPLSIELGTYKATIHQEDTALQITIYKNSGLRYAWSHVPYTYTATWQ